MDFQLDAILRSLVHFYQTQRRVGHTQLMFEGFTRTEKAKCVVLTPAHAATIKLNIRDYVCVDNLMSLTGTPMPICFDNYTLAVLFERCLGQLHSQFAEIIELKKENKDLKKSVKRKEKHKK